jgi:hypothetical protein
MTANRLSDPSFQVVIQKDVMDAVQWWRKYRPTQACRPDIESGFRDAWSGAEKPRFEAPAMLHGPNDGFSVSLNFRATLLQYGYDPTDQQAQQACLNIIQRTLDREDLG